MKTILLTVVLPALILFFFLNLAAREMLPPCSPKAAVSMARSKRSIIFALAVIIEAMLSFLGIGIPPPTPSWGTMLSDSRRYMGNSVWMALFPGLTLSIAVLGFNMLGDGLRDLLDPRT